MHPDDDLMPGVVAILHGWGHGACEPLSDMARLTAIPVELRPGGGG